MLWSVFVIEPAPVPSAANHDETSPPSTAQNAHGVPGEAPTEPPGVAGTYHWSTVITVDVLLMQLPYTNTVPDVVYTYTRWPANPFTVRPEQPVRVVVV